MQLRAFGGTYDGINAECDPRTYLHAMDGCPIGGSVDALRAAFGWAISAVVGSLVPAIALTLLPVFRGTSKQGCRAGAMIAAPNRASDARPIEGTLHLFPPSTFAWPRNHPSADVS